MILKDLKIDRDDRMRGHFVFTIVVYHMLRGYHQPRNEIQMMRNCCHIKLHRLS